jgi:CheY-like chemotaxis protein
MVIGGAKNAHRNGVSAIIFCFHWEQCRYTLRAHSQNRQRRAMKTILLVDDDAAIVEIYRQRFVQEGFQVATASDGLAAAKILREGKPDLVVLDLMMPKFSGVELLRFIRSQPHLDSTPVAIFTNSFMSELADAANGIGVQRTIAKAECTPGALVKVAKEILSSGQDLPGTDHGPAALAMDRNTRVRHHFLDHAPDTLAALRTLHQEFVQSPDPAATLLKLEGLYRKVHFVASVAGLAGCQRVALLCSAFEALLFELLERPQHIDQSVLHTISVTLEFLEVLFDGARAETVDEHVKGSVLVVDDDPLSNHLVVAALRRARLDARAAENPLIGLELLTRENFDLVLLDIEMPYMTGFDLCRKLRTLPGYARTPVIYVTAHSDFENRSKGILAGGNDLIAKPVFPIELAVKSVMHLIKSRLPATAAGQ